MPGQMYQWESVPAIVIFIEVEAAPRVLIRANADVEEQRVWDWISAHCEYRALVERALELAEQDRAA